MQITRNLPNLVCLIITDLSFYFDRYIINKQNEHFYGTDMEILLTTSRRFIVKTVLLEHTSDPKLYDLVDQRLVKNS